MFEPKGPKPIQGYEARLDEYQTAGIWERPVRNYHTDTPFYPWMRKPPTNSVSALNLAFKKISRQYTVHLSVSTSKSN